MPIQKFRDMRSGKSYSFEWDKSRPPTRDEFDEMIAQQSGMPVPVPDPSSQPDVPPPSPMKVPGETKPTFWERLTTRDQGSIGDRLQTSMDTLYGGPKSVLPAIPGVTRPILPELSEDRANEGWLSWGGHRAYDALRGSSSALGLATDTVASAGIGKAASALANTRVGQAVVSKVSPYLGRGARSVEAPLSDIAEHNVSPPTLGPEIPKPEILPQREVSLPMEVSSPQIPERPSTPDLSRGLSETTTPLTNAGTPRFNSKRNAARLNEDMGTALDRVMERISPDQAAQMQPEQFQQLLKDEVVKIRQERIAMLPDSRKAYLDMGPDVPGPTVYHGTPDLEKVTKSGFDPSKGTGTQLPGMTHFAEDPARAEAFTKRTVNGVRGEGSDVGGGIIPAKLKVKNPIDLTTATPEQVLNIRKGLSPDQLQDFDKLYTVYKGKIPDYHLMEYIQKMSPEQFKQTGFDAVRYSEGNPLTGAKNYSWAVPEGTDIRSPYSGKGLAKHQYDVPLSDEFMPGKNPSNIDLHRATQRSMYPVEPPQFSLPDVATPGRSEAGLRMNALDQTDMFGQPKKGLFGKIASDSGGDRAQKAVSSLKSIMSSIDFSAPRQLAATMGDKEFWKNTPELFKNLSTKHYEELNKAIRMHPRYEEAVKRGVKFTNISEPLAGREEQFLQSYAEDVPILGRILKASERSFTGTINKVRMDFYNNIAENVEKSVGKTLSTKQGDDIGKIVNTLTGRGDLGKYEGYGDKLSTYLFSPRLMKSRLDVLGISDLNPASKGFYRDLDPAVRKEALKSVIKSASLATSALAMAKYAGAEVETDPRSADFGKIKIGNTRIDMTGGHGQYIKLLAQLTPGAGAKSTTTGKIHDPYNPKPLESSAYDIARRTLFENKAAPLASLVIDLMSGKDFKGDPVTVKSAVVQRITPMITQDLKDLMEDDPSTVGLIIPGVFGFGEQTYKEKPSSGRRAIRITRPRISF